MEQNSDWGRHVAKIPNVISLKWLDDEYARGHNVNAIHPGIRRGDREKAERPGMGLLAGR
jgi:hypothetical protein